MEKRNLVVQLLDGHSSKLELTEGLLAIAEEILTRKHEEDKRNWKAENEGLRVALAKDHKFEIAVKIHWSWFAFFYVVFATALLLLYVRAN